MCPTPKHLSVILSICALVAACGIEPEEGTDLVIQSTQALGITDLTETKLLPSEDVTGDRFGNSVGVSGQTVVVGASSEDVRGINSGAVHVFTYSGGSWAQQAMLNASDGEEQQRFGQSVAISGDIVVVRSSTNLVYIFRRTGTIWSEQAKLTVEDAASIAVSGSTIIVGAPSDDEAGQDAGAVHVFKDTVNGWIQQAKLLPGEAGERVGLSVAIDGNRAMIGTNGRGAFVYTRSGGAWSQSHEFAPHNGINECFGCRVAISGATAVIGAPYSDFYGWGAIYVSDLDANGWRVPVKLPPLAFRSTSDQLGLSVAISGDTILGGLNRSMPVVVWNRSAGVWTRQGSLDAGVGGSGDYGRSVALDGGTAIIGASNHASSDGAAFVFKSYGTTWGSPAELERSYSQAGDLFGRAVSIDGSRAVVTSTDGPGAIHLYEHGSGGWSKKAELTAGRVGDYLGTAVSISGISVAAGAPMNDDEGKDAGAAFLFKHYNHRWNTIKLSPGCSPGCLAAGDRHGQSVAVSGEGVIVGTPGHDANGEDAGAAFGYVVRESDGKVTSLRKLLASDGAAHDNFGWAVAISGDLAVVGAPRDDDKGTDSGSVYVFKRRVITGGTFWDEKAKLTASDGVAGDRFGSAVAINGDTIVVGAPFDNARRGSAYAFVGGDSSWTQQKKLTAADGTSYDYFGNAVAIDDEMVVVGAYGAPEGGISSGATYVYLRNGTNWSEHKKLTAADRGHGDNFGRSVAVSGNTVLSSAYLDDDLGSNCGAAYIHTLQFANGTSCSAEAQCNSGFCVDGVCCNTSCGGGSIFDPLACSKDAGARYDGTCGSIIKKLIPPSLPKFPIGK